MNGTFPPSRPAFLTVLCWVLWLFGAAFVAYAAWLAAALPAGGRWPAVAAAGITGAAAVLSGMGLYRMRRWGVVLFGALALLGSVNHLSGAIQRFTALSSAAPALAVGAILSVLGGLLIPFALIYIVLQLWRASR